MPAPDPKLDAKLAEIQAAIAAGDHARALTLCQRLSKQSPAHPAPAALQSLVHLHLGQMPQAIFFAQRRAALSPADPAAHLALAGLLIDERRTDEALAAIDRARALTPDDPAPARLASLAQAQAGRYVASLWQVEHTLALLPSPDPALLSLGATCLLNLGRPADAAAMLRRALDRADAALLPQLTSQLALTLNYDPAATREDTLAAHRAYAATLPPSPTPAESRTLSPGPRLRVGIVSPDLRTHSVAFFLLPWLRQRGRDAAEVFAYFTNRHPDALTATIRGLCDHWRDMGNISDEHLALTIARDRLDVLLELSGHTAGHCLAALRLRPAPVQATFIGYPNTTGLPEVGMRIVDSITDPAPAADAWCVERLVRLDPCFLCFEPPAAAPPVTPRVPASPLTFGSFNAAPKINDAVLSCWARLLAARPGSRLLLKAVQYDEPAAREHLLRRFEHAGGPAGALEVLPPAASQRDHLASYARVDVALDPFPYHGTTTTLEALWMGVPVVTLAGDRHASRVGVSILSAAGLPDLIAPDLPAYERLALSLADDAPRRHTLRTTLRERVASSVLCDARGYARRLDAALRDIAGTIAP
jgi:protein O-GlcNAc transferase